MQHTSGKLLNLPIALFVIMAEFLILTFYFKVCVEKCPDITLIAKSTTQETAEFERYCLNNVHINNDLMEKVKDGICPPYLAQSTNSMLNFYSLHV